jgi:hypothetical protein
MRIATKYFKREVRRVRHIKARLVLRDSCDRDCNVLDVSQHGAKVVVEAGLAVPQRFEIAFGEQCRLCDLIWRRGNTVGVKFVH